MVTSNKASTEALQELQPLCSLSVCASPLCAEVLSNPCTVIIALMIALLPDRRPSCDCCGVVFKRATVFQFHLSFSMDHYPNVCGDLWAPLPMLGAVPVWRLSSTHWLPLFVYVHVGFLCVLHVCVDITKCELCCCCKGLLKPMWACLFQSVWGGVIVFLSACVRPVSPPPSSRVSLLVTGYSNFLLCWVRIVFKTERCEL